MTSPRFETRKEMRAAYRDGPPAYYLVDGRSAPLDGDPLVFCCEECRGEWVRENKRPGSRQPRLWRFVKGRPPCDQCGRLLFGKQK